MKFALCYFPTAEPDDSLFFASVLLRQGRAVNNRSICNQLFFWMKEEQL